MDDVKKASEISDCSECPLYQTDCPGGWTSDGAGRPVEPPCTSWNDDDEIYEGMYDYQPTEAELEEWTETSKRLQAERKEYEHQYEIDCLRRTVRSLTGGEYRHIEFRHNGTAVYDWLCPYCHRWTFPGWESGHNGVLESWCNRCNRRMVYCFELEKEDFL